MFREIRLKADQRACRPCALLCPGAVAIWRLIAAAGAERPGLAVTWALVFGLVALGAGGLFTVQPNEAKVLTLFGRYVGTVRDAGLWWANPFYAKKRISLRVRNFETGKLKVNDIHSNPIEIGAIVVWKVIDSAEAMFEVDDYQNYRPDPERVGGAGAGAVVSI